MTKPTFKQISFDTSIRNPERYLDFFKFIVDYKGIILNNENILKIVVEMYKKKLVTSDKLNPSDSDFKKQVIIINSTRKSDGGYPSGYCSRFWTYFRTPSELGLIYAQYNQKLIIPKITSDLVNDVISEQEAFSIQTIQHNRKNPYKNVSNDFNFFKKFLKILITKNSNRLSIEQFILLMFSKNSDIEEYLSILSQNSFNDLEKIYDFLQENFKKVNCFNTTCKDYPDNLIRILNISGFITIDFEGKKIISINKNNIKYIEELLNFFDKNIQKITEEEKYNKLKYFEYMNRNYEVIYKKLILKYRQQNISSNDYNRNLTDLINKFGINLTIIKGELYKLLTQKRPNFKEIFKDIPNPLKLEFFITLLLFFNYNNQFNIIPNYKADHFGKPYSHAPGNKSDIQLINENIIWNIEVSLIRNKDQQLNSETTSVIRHFNDTPEYEKKYLSFVSPFIHSDTETFYINQIWGLERSDTQNIFLKPYCLEDFITITCNKQNLEDMEEYFKQKIKK